MLINVKYLMHTLCILVIVQKRNRYILKKTDIELSIFSPLHGPTNIIMS